MRLTITHVLAVLSSDRVRLNKLEDCEVYLALAQGLARRLDDEGNPKLATSDLNYSVRLAHSRVPDIYAVQNLYKDRSTFVLRAEGSLGQSGAFCHRQTAL